MAVDLRALASAVLVDSDADGQPDDALDDALGVSDATSPWRASGAAALTGRFDGPPLNAPAGVAQRVALIGRVLSADLARGLTAGVHRPIAEVPERIDPFTLLTERSHEAGFVRRSPFSCGGATKLVRVGGNWVVIALPRPSDRESVPALLEIDSVPGDAWETIERADISSDAVVERSHLLGLAAALVAETPVPTPADPAARFTSADGLRTPERPLVVDFSALWAGPLCARLLSDAGFAVVKVESAGRPDGARSGPPEFFARLHHGHEFRTYDFADADQLLRLRALVARADIVVEASRPRALARLGLSPSPHQIWVSITGYGRRGLGQDRVAFGDDAAIAGGLVARDASGPEGCLCFCADAIADPLTGMVAAWAALRAWHGRRGGVLDVAMARVAAWFATDLRAARNGTP